MNTEAYISRIKLIDEPFVKQMLSNKHKKSKIQFIDGDFDHLGFDYYVDGFRQSVRTIRNSKKFAKSNYFTVPVDKNNLTSYSNTLYAFIDEVSSSVYLLDGLLLLQYLVENPNCIKENEFQDKKTTYALVSKKDIMTWLKLENDPSKKVSSNSVIYYNKEYANYLSKVI